MSRRKTRKYPPLKPNQRKQVRRVKSLRGQPETPYGERKKIACFSLTPTADSLLKAISEQCNVPASEAIERIARSGEKIKENLGSINELPQDSDLTKSKSTRGQFENCYGQLKQRVYFSLTPTAIKLLKEISRDCGVRSATELLERVVRLGEQTKQIIAQGINL